MENTKHLDLKQWELEDFILMEDFNADNQKVDAAFGAMQQAQQQAAEQLQQMQNGLALQKLGSAVGGADRMVIDLSGVDLSQYSRLYLHIQCHNLNSAAVRLFFADNISSSTSNCLSLGTGTTGDYTCQLQLAPLQNGFWYEYVSGNSENTKGSHSTYSTLATPASVEGLYVVAYNGSKLQTFDANCRATLYGWTW